MEYNVKTKFADEQLDGVSGGKSNSSGDTKDYAAEAASEGRTIFCDTTHPCEFCHEQGYMYAQNIGFVKIGPDVYIDVKCYKCGCTYLSVSPTGFFEPYPSI
jgi:hypothetical protein